MKKFWFAGLIGIIGLSFFAGAFGSELLQYVNQGRPDPVASEYPDPVLPSMSIFSFIINAFLPSCGILGSVLYCVYFFLLIIKRNSKKLLIVAATLGCVASFCFLPHFIKFFVRTYEVGVLLFFILPLTLFFFYSLNVVLYWYRVRRNNV